MLAENALGILVDYDDECGYYCDPSVRQVDHRETVMLKVGKEAAVVVLDGREWRKMPW